MSYWEELTALGLTAAAAPRTPSTFSGLAPHCHKQPFPWCSLIPKGELSNNLNSVCYSPSALGRALGELRAANTTTGKLSNWRRAVPFIHQFVLYGVL